MLGRKMKQNECASSKNEKDKKKKHLWEPMTTMIIIGIIQRKDESIIFTHAKLINMEESQQMINEQELDWKKRRREPYFVNWFEDDKTEKSIVSHVDEHIDFDCRKSTKYWYRHEMWLQKMNNQVIRTSTLASSHGNVRQQNRQKQPEREECISTVSFSFAVFSSSQIEYSWFRYSLCWFVSMDIVDDWFHFVWNDEQCPYFVMLHVNERRIHLSRLNLYP
jgi:hypothetical protein